ncbi:hypothetical protein KUTeg_012391 [Tegillarca granosa]|uniref:Signal peptidase complex subunit 2 n=1 Tax=Tegillarca granosa TaxID=220873 RepID=A0ABQ9F2V0_TEGGR|nr:hypothetical protein KUTeg_012391 [Tegillarca granosa]
MKSTKTIPCIYHIILEYTDLSRKSNPPITVSQKKSHANCYSTKPSSDSEDKKKSTSENLGLLIKETNNVQYLGKKGFDFDLHNLVLTANQILWNIDEKPVKIDKWDTAALKNALDDAAKKVMIDKFGFVESHRLMDGRYFILMGVLTVYTTYKEKGIFLVALDKDRAGVDPDNVWQVASRLKKYTDEYHLSMTFIDGKTGKTRSDGFTKSVAEFFDENGVLCFDLFEPNVRMLEGKIATSKKE